MRHVNLSLSWHQCSTHCMRGGEAGVLRLSSRLATQKGNCLLDSPAPFICRNMMPSVFATPFSVKLWFETLFTSHLFFCGACFHRFYH